MSPEHSGLSETFQANRGLWLVYLVACAAALLWVGFTPGQGIAIFAGMFVSLIVLSFSLIIFGKLVAELRKDALPAAERVLQNPVAD
jgi:hypothetical protein